MSFRIVWDMSDERLHADGCYWLCSCHGQKWLAEAARQRHSWWRQLLRWEA